MMLYKIRGLKRLFKAVYIQLRIVVRGISGADRRAKRRLRHRHSALKAQYDLLNREKEEMRSQLSRTNRHLKTRYEELEAERDDLQFEIWELEDLLEELFELLASAEAWQPPPKPASKNTVEPKPWVAPQASDHEASILVEDEDEPASAEAVDLSSIKLALVGGHDSTRRGVISELTQLYGLTQWVELPPFDKHGIGRSNIKAKIHDCDLIVVITGYMKHKQSTSIMQMSRLKSLSGEVLLLNCRGKSGVVREILAHVSQKRG